MASFGFNRPTAVDFRHPTQGPGFGAAPDPFASISHDRGRLEDDDAIDFDDTYDGLGDQLGEEDDDLNEDTFGGEETSKPVGKDFDFFGSTSKVTNAINEEAIRFNRHQPTSKPSVNPPSQSKQPSKPFKTGYEAYKNPAYIPDLQADAALWGTTPAKQVEDSRKQHPDSSAPPISGSRNLTTGGGPAKKMMSLEEVEAAMKAQPRIPPAPVPAQHTQNQSQTFRPAQEHSIASEVQPPHQPPPYVERGQARGLPHENDYGLSQANMQERPLQFPNQDASDSSQSYKTEFPKRTGPSPVAPQPIVQHGHSSSTFSTNPYPVPQARQNLQSSQRAPSQFSSQASNLPNSTVSQHNFSTFSHLDSHVPMPIIYHPSQIMNLPEDERNAYLVEEAKRAKRNHKIFLLSKGNGLMTPQDKNFITRIQLQQLMTATGNATEHNPDGALSEDFYYQVYNQIENRQRQNPQQPLSHFAQTYLFRTGNRQGGMGRRQRGGDGHVQRMEQQVQRAVEAAKAKPKNKQLVIEGSLGKISFSNAKTPKPLLNIRRHDSHDSSHRQNNKKALQAGLSTSDRKAVLKNVEAVYTTLMAIEDHDRHLPPPATEDSDPTAVQTVVEWQQTFQALNQQLWADLKVIEPIMSDSKSLHPFIAFLSYPKGKKAMPRIFNHIDENQRLTILTMIMVHLDVLDVIRLAQPKTNKTQPLSMALEQVDLFLQAVMPSLFSFVSEAQLAVVIGLLGLVTERANLNVVARTRVGLEVLTMLLSRAAIVRATETPEDQTWDQWVNVYNHFFDLVEPLFIHVFPMAVNAGQDQYIWQFLAATGSGANPEQQQRLVLAVKDRVMETLQQSKTLPPELASQRRNDVNLFMQAIGLDVAQLDD